jgi:hypothetical protein
MSIQLKGALMAHGQGLVLISGSFAVANSAVTATRTNRPPWKADSPFPTGYTAGLQRMAAGVYQIYLQQAYQSVVETHAEIVPASGLSASNLTTAKGGYADFVGDFMKTNGAYTQFLSDTTGRYMLLLTYNTAQNALADVPANYRCVFHAVLATSAMNK